MQLSCKKNNKQQQQNSNKTDQEDPVGWVKSHEQEKGKQFWALNGLLSNKINQTKQNYIWKNTGKKTPKTWIAADVTVVKLILKHYWLYWLC